ncbi:DUF3159 domain-containing protein [Goodfellowiella coeruleoviolacea]|uniref:DUF3159 domain-containing protein n=1 Tax=Goodfellowiella coeruleoviolacea TaxID=334858 RepID=A0AAE3GAW4_9PSEU|nr:DUF3159 domain-containing protein [Goodfellowiella coeruleoviolacea]MCP2164755.1 Protein of unknown function (DUF3159) [Goodfellowiella coeruleoviolacea]
MTKARVESERRAGGEPDRPQTTGGRRPDEETLAQLLGGRGGALDATLPPVAFVVGWALPGNSIPLGAAAAIAVGLVVGVIRLLRRDRPRAVVVSVALVVIAALVAMHTGRAADFFLLQILSNVASALAWAASIVVRWPLLGVVVGLVLGQKFRWRRDPDLLRAYGVASWAWVGQYVLRIVVYGALYLADQVLALGIARVALSWPLQVVCLAVSWWMLRRVLPADHPGLRHPRVPEARPQAG